MKQIFVDTSAWLALLDRRDSYHEQAVIFFDRIKNAYRLVSSNYVLDELYTISLINTGYTNTVKAHRMLTGLQQKRQLRIVWVDQAMGRNAWSIFEKYNVDKSWSSTDCVSCSVMKQIGINEAFTFDHHFSQMGFDRSPDIS